MKPSNKTLKNMGFVRHNGSSWWEHKKYPKIYLPVNPAPTYAQIIDEIVKISYDLGEKKKLQEIKETLEIR